MLSYSLRGSCSQRDAAFPGREGSGGARLMLWNLKGQVTLIMGFGGLAPWTHRAELPMNNRMAFTRLSHGLAKDTFPAPST